LIGPATTRTATPHLRGVSGKTTSTGRPLSLISTGSLDLREEILQLVYAAIDDVNAQALTDTAIAKRVDTPLLGSDAAIDSLTFVNLIVALEEQIQAAFGRSVVLVDEDSMSLRDQPFRTVGSLAEYAETVIARAHE
jgi:acyl carrier protein